MGSEFWLYKLLYHNKLEIDVKKCILLFHLIGKYIPWCSQCDLVSTINDTIYALRTSVVRINETITLLNKVSLNPI